MKITKVIKNIFGSIDWLNIPAATYVRYILTILTTVNTILTMFGFNPLPVEEDAIYQVISVVLNAVVLLVNTYKDNPTSKEALFTNKIMKALKDMSDVDEADILKILAICFKEGMLTVDELSVIRSILNGEVELTSASAEITELLEKIKELPPVMNEDAPPDGEDTVEEEPDAEIEEVPEDVSEESPVEETE